MQHNAELIDPALRAPLEQFPGLDITRENVAQIRAGMASMPKAETPFAIKSEAMTVAAEVEVPVMVYRESDRPNQPALLWVHGGGYLFGSADDERAKVIAHTHDVTVVSVDYRMAPEHPFPAGPNDCYAVLGWLFSEDCPLDVDRSRIAIGGASAGGGMSAGLALMNRDKDNHPVVFQLLIYPMIDNLHATASGSLEGHAIWNRKTSFNAWEMYLDGVPGEQASPYAAASRASNLSGLPPAFVCVGAEDLFRDEDIEYARRLIAAGVPTELLVVPGVYHAAEGMAPDAPVSQRLNQSIMTAIGHALA